MARDLQLMALWSHGGGSRTDRVENGANTSTHIERRRIIMQTANETLADQTVRDHVETIEKLVEFRESVLEQPLTLPWKLLNNARQHVENTLRTYFTGE